MTTTPIVPAAFTAEKELVNTTYELFRLIENSGIFDPREASICLNLCMTYNNALQYGGIPEQGFVAPKPLEIMKGLTMATKDEQGRPDHPAINQAIVVALAILQFQAQRLQGQAQMGAISGTRPN